MSKIKNNFNKSAASYANHAFIQKEISIRLTEKISAINIKPKIVADLGAGIGIFTNNLLKNMPESKILSIDFAQQTLERNNAKIKICADVERIPISENSVDLMTSNLMLQWCDNLDVFFAQCYRILKPNGLIIFSTFGPDTLKELKASYLDANLNPSVNTFIDMHDIGDKILLSGFEGPVMEMEMLTLMYENVIDLMKDLKGIGAQTVKNKKQSIIGKNKFNNIIKMYEKYRRNGKLPATYEVIYGHAWKKDNSIKQTININSI